MGFKASDILDILRDFGQDCFDIVDCTGKLVSLNYINANNLTHN